MSLRTSTQIVSVLAVLHCINILTRTNCNQAQVNKNIRKLDKMLRHNLTNVDA